MNSRMMLLPMMRHLNNWAVAPRKGGGGSSDSTTTSSSKTVIDDQFRPHVDQGLEDLKSAYDSGALGMTAGASELQMEAFGAASGSADTGISEIEESRSAYRDAMNGTGMFDPTNIEGMERAAIDQAARERGVMNDGFASAGVIGGSRASVAAGDRDAQLANALASLKYDQFDKTKDRAMWGADSLSDSGVKEADLLTGNLSSLYQLGGEQRGIEQELLDSDAKALENYLAGMQTFMPIMSSQEQTSTTTGSSKKSGK